MAQKVEFQAVSVSPAACAKRGDYGTLAALAVHGNPTAQVEALKLLVDGSSNPEALSWLLMCLEGNEVGWTYATSWPPVVNVEPPNAALIRSLVLNSAADPQGLRAQALAEMLPAVKPPQIRHEFARAILKANGQDHAMHEAARLVLAGSTDLRDRQALMVDARQAPLPEQILRLARLLSATRPVEVTAIRQALTELAVQAINLAPTHIEAAQRLAVTLADTRLSEWLLGAWVYEPARTAIVDGRFGELLGGRRLRLLMGAATPPGLVPLLTEAARTLEPDEDSLVMAAAYSAGFAVPDSVNRFLVAELRPEAWDIASACADNTVAEAIGLRLSLGGLTVGARRLAGSVRAPALVAAAASAWAMTGTTSDPQGRRIPPEGWEEQVLEAAAILGDELLVALAFSPGLGFAYPAEVISAALKTRAPIAAFAESGQASMLLDHVLGSTHSPDQAVALLQWLPGSDDPIQESLLGVVGWDDNGRWGAAVGACRRMVLAKQVKRQTESLSGPQADRVSDSALVATLHAALNAGMEDELGTTTVPVLSTLLDSNSDGVVTLACKWVQLLPISMERHELVKDVIHADNQRSHRHLDLAALRALLADRLVAAALDAAKPDEDRTAHLQLAATAGPAVARAAALTIKHPDSDALRLVAAELLVETPGSATEERVIEGLMAEAKKQPLRDKLSQARNALSAPDLVSGLASLATQLDLNVGRNEVIEARVDRYPEHGATLLQLVNDVRNALGPASQVKDFVNNANSLSDKLVDLAVVARHDRDASFLSAGAVDAIRRNSRNRMDSGALVVNQLVLQTLPWVQHVGSLRQSRAAHPSRLGTNDPVVFAETDRIATRYLLGSILAGWLDTMRDSA